MSVTVPWVGGTEMLRGPDVFDSERRQAVRFISATIKGVDPYHFQVPGALEIRGISHPLTLRATLERERDNLATGAEIAEFTATGMLSRADYGMTAHPVMISDRVRLVIAARRRIGRTLTAS